MLLFGAVWCRKCKEHQKAQKAPKCTEIVGEGEVNTGKCKEHQNAQKARKSTEIVARGGGEEVNAKEVYRAPKSTKRTKKHRNVGEWGRPTQRNV